MSDVRSGYGAPVPGAFSGSKGTPLYIDLEAGVAYFMRRNEVIEMAGGEGGPATWGDIQGNLADQADLQAALDTKANAADLATVAKTGSYTDLTNRPAIFNGQYGSLTGIPSTFAPIIGPGATQACAGNDARLSDARNPIAHNQAAATISDSTSVGRAVLTAANEAAARTAIGAGTGSSNFSGSYADLTNKPTIPIVRSARTTAQRTTTSTSLGNVIDLAITILANEVVSFDVYLFGGCNNTGGSQFSVTIPAGASCRVQWTGNTNGATAFTTGVITASDAVSPTFYTVNAGGRIVEGHGVVVNGATPGIIQVRFKSVTNGQTTTVDQNSILTGRVH